MSYPDIGKGNALTSEELAFFREDATDRIAWARNCATGYSFALDVAIRTSQHELRLLNEIERLRQELHAS